MAKLRKRFTAVMISVVIALGACAGLLGLYGCSSGCGGDAITLSKRSISIGEGESYTLTVVGADKNEVEWRSDNTAVATVSNGVVTGVSAGTASVTATAGKATAVCSVTVTRAGEDDVEVPDEVTTDFIKTEKDDIYTYNAYYSVSPKTWNPHTWESAYDSLILNYTTMGFYGVRLNANGDGYEWTSEMAAAFPTDVTSRYIGRFGISSGDARKAWEIKLNPKACWEDGTAITADDYIYSMKAQLDPEMLNRRIDGFTSGELSIYGARNYVYSLSAATYETVDAAGYESVRAAIDAGEKLYFDMWATYGMEGAPLVKEIDRNGGTCEIDGSVTMPQWNLTDDETPYLDPAYYDDLQSGACTESDILKYVVTTAEIFNYFISGDKGGFENGGEYYSSVAVRIVNQNRGYEWDEGANGGVGLLKTGVYKIVLVLNTAIDDFTLKYGLSSTWLVNEPLYEKCKVDTGGLVSSTYGTSADTYISYGPYKLVSYVNDNSFKCTANEYWYGYSDGRHAGQYQTTSVAYTYLDAQTAKSTSYQLFLQGKLDDYNLDGSEMGTFGNSKFLYTTPESYTYQFFLCTDYDKLHERDAANENHSVLSLTNFRKALSYCIQRAAYCAAYDPASQPGFGVLNYMYVIDPDTGATYRDTEAAKRVILEVNDFVRNADGSWTSRNGHVYEDTDDAYGAVTGYDKEYAADLFEAAYKEAVASGIYNGATPVVIDRGATAVSEAGTSFINDLNGWIQEALSLCDEPTFPSVTVKYNTKYNSSTTFWAAVKGGELDLAFSAWGGSAMSPWATIYNCYVDKGNTLNYGFTGFAESKYIEIDADGETISATLSDWSKWLANFQDDNDYQGRNLYKKLGIPADCDINFKVEVLAACEKAQLLSYSNLPIFYSAQNALHSAKYELGADEYLQLIGFGGVRHMRYNYTDADWTAWVNSQGGNLESFYRAS